MKAINSLSRIEVDEKKCNLCLKCIDVCPQQLFKFENGKVFAPDADICLGCMKCVNVCEPGAINLNLSGIKKFFITKKCNNNCIMCFESSRNKVDDPSFEEIISSFDSLLTGKEKLIVLHGAEPTLRRDIFQILEHLKKYNFPIFFPTNGRMFAYKEFAKRLVELKLPLMIAFTILGSNERTHDAITRTPRSFKQAVQGLKNLYDLKYDDLILKINFVILKQNFEEIFEMVKLFYNLVDEIQLSYVEPGGDAQLRYSILAPKFEDLKEYFYKCFEFDKQNKVFTKNIPLCYLSKPEKNMLYTLNQFRERVKKCKVCPFKNKCPGFWKQYLEVYSEVRELK